MLASHTCIHWAFLVTNTLCPLLICNAFEIHLRFPCRYVLRCISVLHSNSSSTVSWYVPCLPFLVKIYPHLASSACSIPCLVNADLGNCSATDNVCLCKSQAFVNSTTACIENACTGADLANAEADAEAICASVVCPFLYHHALYRQWNIDWRLITRAYHLREDRLLSSDSL